MSIVYVTPPAWLAVGITYYFVWLLLEDMLELFTDWEE